MGWADNGAESLGDLRRVKRVKRNLFTSFNPPEMQQLVHIESVHERIARVLKIHALESVPAWAIEFVANVRGQQLDWRKRLRELRYGPIGLEIEVSKKRDQKGCAVLLRPQELARPTPEPRPPD